MGVTATTANDWDTRGFSIEWQIAPNGNQWINEYTVTATKKDVSHMLLEITDDGLPFDIYDGSSPFGEIKTWSKSGDQDLSNPLYGGKFDFEGLWPVIYTLITNRAPV